VRKALSVPANQCSCRSARKARTCSRREWPRDATKKNTFFCSSPIQTLRSPKSICSYWPGRVSKRAVARASAWGSLRRGRHCLLHRPQAHHNALLSGELRGHDIGIARMLPEPLGNPVLEAIQRLATRDLRHLAPATLGDPALHRVPRTAQFRRNPLRPPGARLQRQHRVRQWPHRCLASASRSFPTSPSAEDLRPTLPSWNLLSTGGSQFLMSPGGQFAVSPDTIKDATVKPFHYDSHDQLRTHLADFLAAYNFARRLKTLCGLTPYEYTCEIWTSEPDRFILDPIHQIPGLNT
jgi:hypothetical protein